MTDRETKSRALVRKYYADVPSRETMLERTITPLLRASDALLDAGCGETLALLQQYGPQVAIAVGVDVVAPTVPPASGVAVARGDLSALPFRDGAFDVIVSRSVVEHLRDPVAVFGELSRALKPGGKLVFTTPNKYYYSSLIARSIPYAWKDRYLHWAFKEESYDHFPVYYRANTRRALRRIAAQTHLELRSLQALRHFPYYFLFSPALFRVGMLYDWLVTGLKLDDLQSNWLVVMERRSV